ncbi:BREX system P-loop protein BrxC [Corynebacterium phoceense]|uniref:BREX system P-loop protein BrxC n=1 Tax=Corynebacterium phoceense TaxID=1686286 RepID=UPI001D89EC5A|nr:BREX system P-loop protein BrxC [Corynebacterium phoceense]HJG42479.1 BREX system P-loop protein BrxC [Corynebacterium phoceense]
MTQNLRLNDIFKKDVQRPIEGVIKADDVSQLGTEVEEYVLTNEISKGLEQLLEAYNNYTNANGVWISGFFGSGKSHLLKMLAHLLGDVDGQDFDRTKVAASFNTKAEDDAFLSACLQKAERIPAKSLLFNIDQKATLIDKSESDALLSVFLKVFDDSCGYYGNQPHIAQFERDLDNKGLLDTFKEAYSRISGQPWETGREMSILEDGNVSAAYGEVTGVSTAPTNILAQYRADHKVSIEDFAELVHDWLEKQPVGYRLNFFVDEVGQFIGSNTRLMLNLQTVAESLNTKCKGQAWVFVTSQEDMEKILGDRTKSQANDFSKIQARFATRVKLTSADVEEVIRKRLLTKNDDAYAPLASLYSEQKGNFKTLFDFTDGSRSYRNFADEQHFIGSYPFINYQFPLFQSAIESLSDHNVFEGRNSSVGERSMLGVVQQVAKDIGNLPLGALATFDAMYAGIRASLKSSAMNAIHQAERNLDDELAVKLLKALFLVKYVEDFKANSRNLTVLVYDNFGLNLPDLSNRVEQALKLLEQQTYIQRNGDTFEYLTNEEQEVEAEIKGLEVDSHKINARLNKILTGSIVSLPKVRYTKTGQDFKVGCLVDDHQFSNQHDLTVHFITPAYGASDDEVRLQSAGKDEMRVILAPDERVLSDLTLLLQTETYVRQGQTRTNTPARERILVNKRTQISDLEKELVSRVKESVAKATIIINTREIKTDSSAAEDRLTEGFQKLIGQTYTGLVMLGGKSLSKGEIAQALKPGTLIPEGSEEWKTIAAPAEEILNYITLLDRDNERVSMSKLIERFEAKPYGWDNISICVLVARLITVDKLALSLDGNTLKRTEAASYLSNGQKFQNIIVEKQKSYDAAKVATLRNFYKDFFDEPSGPTESIELAQTTLSRLKEKLTELQGYAAQRQYPFLTLLDEPIALLQETTSKKDEWFLTDFDTAEDLLDAKTDTITPIVAFLKGTQRSIFDDARTLLDDNRSNLSQIDETLKTPVEDSLKDVNVFRGNKIPKLKAAMQELQDTLSTEREAQCQTARETIDARRVLLEEDPSFNAATPEAQHHVTEQIQDALNHVERETQFAAIRDIARTFNDKTFIELLNYLEQNKKVVPAPTPTPPTETEVTPPKRVAVKSFVSISIIKVKDRVKPLETAEDVDAYIKELREVLIATINDNKSIRF